MGAGAAARRLLSCSCLLVVAKSPPFLARSAGRWASLIRASAKTFHSARVFGDQLAAVASTELAMGPLWRGLRWPVFWESPCIATRLAEGRAVPRVHGASPNHDAAVAQRIAAQTRIAAGCIVGATCARARRRSLHAHPARKKPLAASCDARPTPRR